jgi:RNA polymerase sigma factor (sigma-70 family)
MSDSDSHKMVWEKFINGDENALLELYDHHYLGLINYGCMLIEDRELVNDCFMDMLIQFWNKRTTLPIVNNVRSYLMTSFRRVVLHKLESEKKREKKQKESLQSSEQYQISYEDYIVHMQSDKDLKIKIAAALNKLTERQLELIRLKFFEDLDYDDIAEKCRITKRTAYNIIYDAIKILKEELNDGQNNRFSLKLLFFFIFLKF